MGKMLCCFWQSRLGSRVAIFLHSEPRAAGLAMSAKLIGESMTLYRSIMRLHRLKLDPQMRSLGDTYARKEFRLHTKPQVTDSQRQMFLREWKSYVDMISLQETVVGQELSAEQKAKLNDQQKVQLDNLEQSAKSLGCQPGWFKQAAMARNSRRRGGNSQGRGKGAGRGGRGQQDGRQPQGHPGPGVVRRQKEKPSRGGRGSGRGNKGGARRRNAGRTNAGPLPASVQTEVREDGMFRHSEVEKAHGDAVMSIVMAADCIYTASRDKTLKRWKVNRATSGKYELSVELEVPLGDVCWCLISAGDWLFCGLGDGSIKGFMKSGTETVLKGHTKRVACLMTHQHVLLSGASDGSVRCWQMNVHSQTFECTHAIDEGISGAVTSLSVLGEGLWVGGTSGVALVELATLKVVKHLEPRRFVSGLLQFDGHMIVVYADGSMCIFDGLGAMKHKQPALPAGPVLCIAGLESGPRVLCGHAKGQISSISLPDFVLKKYWHALERCKVQTLCCAGHDGIYVLGAENGTLQLWQRDGSVDAL
ncbi:ZFWD3 [Symbiodinium necroappetens]|uniref:Succinate dehydrogenase assembly factor 3 n=1 Tax=Symbiodinium necroappetens TaxID=1628268 RepID=A0A812T070_9DINO|nr:ZFWD3 [Symbiodinium necroappetens]